MIDGFGMLFLVVGSNNDINVLNQSSLFVLNQSSLFTDVLQGQAPIVNFRVNDPNTISDTILRTTSTLNSRCSSRVFLLHKVRNISYSQMLEQHSKMSSALLEC
jgi:hypothetical protein